MHLKLPSLQQGMKDQLILGIGTLIVYILSFPPGGNLGAFLTLNGASQYLMTKALVEDLSFEITKYCDYTSPDFVFTTCDIAEYNGKFYSSKPPGASIIAIPFYIVGREVGKLFGLNSELNLTTSVLLSSAVFASLTILIVYRFANLYTTREISLITAISLAFATILWAYSRTFFRHSIVTFFVTLTAYLLVKYGRNNQLNLVFWAGVASGFAIICDWGAILLFVPQIGYLIGKRQLTKLDLQKAGVYVLGPLGGFIFIGIFNLICFGDPLSFSYSNSVYIEDKFDRSLIDLLLDLDPIRYFQQIAFMTFAFRIVEVRGQTGITANRAIFLQTPILILSFVGYFLLYKKDRHLTLFLGSSCLLILLMYARWEEWHGGMCWGSRQLLMIIPLLLIPMVMTIERFGYRRIFWVVFLILFGHSCTTAFIGGISDWVLEDWLAFFQDDVHIRMFLFPNLSLILIVAIELILISRALVNVPKIYRQLNYERKETMKQKYHQNKPLKLPNH
ncbi:MAG: ArnT family glycosyltransferase [Promethearchaeota archaeon]